MNLNVITFTNLKCEEINSRSSVEKILFYKGVLISLITMQTVSNWEQICLLWLKWWLTNFI